MLAQVPPMDDIYTVEIMNPLCEQNSVTNCLTIYIQAIVIKVGPRNGPRVGPPVTDVTDLVTSFLTSSW